MLSTTKTTDITTTTTLVLMIASAVGGAAALKSWQTFATNRKPDPETDHQIGRQHVWKSINGAMNAAMMYIGDRLDLYATLRRLCEKPGSYTTAVELADETGYNQRWLREWLAQQAASGLLRLLPGDGDDDSSLHYRLPRAAADVLADPDSKHYDVPMVQLVPSLVNRARTMLPEAFRTGVGRPYDEPDVADAIDRHHRASVRDFFLPIVLPRALDGRVVTMLERGCAVADLGCGAGVLLLALARRFPRSRFHGFEISAVAVQKACYAAAAARLSNVWLHDANEPGEALDDRPNTFDLVLVYDVLHDSTDPSDLLRQVRSSLKRRRPPDDDDGASGVFLLADIPSLPTTRENLAGLTAPDTYFGISTCLCMSCALSTEGGAGLGTLGFSVPVAKKMLAESGFESCEVLAEDKNVRWFLAT